MEKPAQPPKEEVRKYLEQRQREHRPPPSMEEIRRRLGWGMACRDGGLPPRQRP